MVPITTTMLKRLTDFCILTWFCGNDNGDCTSKGNWTGVDMSKVVVVDGCEGTDNIGILLELFLIFDVTTLPDCNKFVFSFVFVLLLKL